MEIYFNLAKKYSYVVVLVEPKTPWKFQARQLAAKNKHSVSYSKICMKLGQYDEVLPLYFGWFFSPDDCATLQKMAKDILWKCLQVADFQQSIMGFSGGLTFILTTAL